jgi:hypothetical protein
MGSLSFFVPGMLGVLPLALLDLLAERRDLAQGLLGVGPDGVLFGDGDGEVGVGLGSLKDELGLFNLAVLDEGLGFLDLVLGEPEVELCRGVFVCADLLRSPNGRLRRGELVVGYGGPAASDRRDREQGE